MSWYDKLKGGRPPAHEVPAKARAEGRAPTASSPTAPGTQGAGETPAAVSKFLRQAGDLQSIPGVATRLLQMLDDPSTSTALVAEEIRRDQALMALILRIANSAFYKSSGQVRDITESIVVLGYDAVRQLVLGQLSRKVLRKNDVWQRALWRHALATALGAQACARQLRGVTVGHAFTAGLLHDIGKGVMHEAFPEPCTQVWSGLVASKRASQEVEREQFATDHTEVGAELLRRWTFPPLYELAARYHEDPRHPGMSPKDQRVVAMVALGSAVASSLGHDAVPERKGGDPVDHPALEILGNPPGLVDTVKTQIDAEIHGLLEIFA